MKKTQKKSALTKKQAVTVREIIKEVILKKICIR